MTAPPDPNSPPTEFALSPPAAGPASHRPAAKPAPRPGTRLADAVGQSIGGVAARGEPARPQPPDAVTGFGALVARLLGREPTGPELAEFVRVRDALGLRDNDALWLVLLALQHTRGRVEQAIDGQRRAFEQSIGRQRNEFEASIDRRLAETRQTTDALIESAKAQFLRDFPAALKQAARRVALKALGLSGPVVLSGPVAGVALVLAGLGVVGAGGLAYALGERAGYERGVRAQRAEVAPAPKPPPAAVRGR